MPIQGEGKGGRRDSGQGGKCLHSQPPGADASMGAEGGAGRVTGCPREDTAALWPWSGPLVILAHSHKLLSTGCPVSMETSVPTSTSCPLAPAPLGARGNHLGAHQLCREKLGHRLLAPAPQDPGRPPTHAPPAFLLPVSPAGPHARGFGHGSRSLGLRPFPFTCC